MSHSIEKRRAVKRAVYLSLPLALVVGVVSIVSAQGSSETPMTLTSTVKEGEVSKMVTAKGTVSAAKTANLNFRSANNITVVDVKVGDKVKKGQKLGELDNGGLRRTVLQSQQTLAQQQAALDLILNDVNPNGLEKIFERAKAVADQARKNIDLKYKADLFVYERSKHAVDLAEQVEDAAKLKMKNEKGNPGGGTGCNKDGTPVPPVVAKPGPLPTDPPTPDPRLVNCKTDLAAVQAADLARFNAITTMINNRKNLRVNRGGLYSTYRTARQAAATAFNTWNIAKVNRPNQILAQRAVVANATVALGSAVAGLKNSYIYAPVDGTISAIAGTVGEFNAGGNNLNPNTPVSPGAPGTKIPNVGGIAGSDQHNLTGGQGPNLGLQGVLPGGNTFMQISDLSTFSVVAAYTEADAAQMVPGALAKVSFDALPGKDVDGTVTSISPIAAAGPDAAPSYYATVLLNKAPHELKSGMNANVSVVLATVQNKAMVVPTSSVTEDDGKTFVQIPGPDGQLAKKEFTRGQLGDDNSEVVGGLDPGQTVAVPETGALPRPKDDTAPAPGSEIVNVDRADPAKVAPAAPAVPVPGAPAPGAPDPAAPPAPAAPPGDAGTYPGDPGVVADDTGGMGGDGATAPDGSQAYAGQAGIDPFKPMNNSAPAGN